MKKEYDLRKLKKRPGKTRSEPDAAKVPVSIRLDGEVLASLRTEARDMVRIFPRSIDCTATQLDLARFNAGRLG